VPAGSAGVLSELVRIIGVDRNTMAAVEACRCIRALTHGNAATQEQALLSSVIEALVHAISDGAMCMCTRDACMALYAVGLNNAPAQLHAQRCSAVAILLQVLRRQDSCAVAATQALSAVLQHERAAHFAMSVGALDILLKGMQSNETRKKEREIASPRSSAGHAAFAVENLVCSSVTRMQAFVTAGGLDVVDAAVQGFKEAALRGSAVGPDAHRVRPSSLELPAPRASSVAASSQPPAAVLTSWWDYTSIRTCKSCARCVLSNPFCSWKVPALASSAASRAHPPRNLVEGTDPCESKHTAHNRTPPSPSPLRSGSALKPQGVHAICHLISSLSRVSMAMQTRISGTSIIQSMVCSLLSQQNGPSKVSTHVKSIFEMWYLDDWHVH
jgi:hypothetical protein